MRATPSAPQLARPARILIVDDSAVMRALLRSVVSGDKRFEVAGTVADGAAALRAVASIRPDLVLMDVEMPGMDGVNTLKQLKASGSRVPVIMCSSLTQRGAKVTIEALASGAADYVAKPAGQPSRDAAIRTLANDLVPKILALTASATAGSRSGRSAPGFSLNPWPAQQAAQEVAGARPRAADLLSQRTPSAPPAVVLIGASTGGPAALDVVLPALPADFPLPILIVQHMPELFTKLLAERLSDVCPLRVSEAEAGTPVRAGAIVIARGGWHMEVASAASAAPVLRLTQEPPENFCRPAVDVLFRSAIPVYGPRILAVILTGMGSDGLAGSRVIRESGGTILVQDQPTSAVWGMPGAVAQAGLAHRILPLNAIAPEILRLAGRSQREAIELRESAV
jgi:two-component system chemotaxis response regulator CheB